MSVVFITEECKNGSALDYNTGRDKRLNTLVSLGRIKATSLRGTKIACPRHTTHSTRSWCHSDNDNVLHSLPVWNLFHHIWHCQQVHSSLSSSLKPVPPHMALTGSLLKFKLCLTTNHSVCHHESVHDDLSDSLSYVFMMDSLLPWKCSWWAGICPWHHAAFIMSH